MSIVVDWKPTKQSKKKLSLINEQEDLSKSRPSRVVKLKNLDYVVRPITARAAGLANEPIRSRNH